MRTQWLAFLLLTVLSLISRAGLLDDEPEFLPVDRAFPLTTSVDGGLLVAQWETQPGYYLYEHRLFVTQGDKRLTPASFSIEGKEKFDEAFGDVVAYYGPLEVLFRLDTLSAGEVTLHYQGCADAGLCYPPQRHKLELTTADIASAVALSNDKSAEGVAVADNQATAADTTSRADASSKQGADWFEGSTLTTIGLFFLLGIGLTFTPCVLPMVPIMTSVVMGQNQQISARRGFILSTTYVSGMAITYAAAGVVMGLLGAGANIQAWMQTPWVLILFAVMFVLLALAMFGVYELQLPSGIRNRLNQASQKQSGGHIASVFLIGVLSALVVSPCVSAPLAGALVYLSTTGDVLLGGAALLALGFGMGTPLIVLGTTGGSVLPKAGMWMEQIKIFFGVLLLAVAIWLLTRIIPASVSLLLFGVLALVYAVVLGALNDTTPRLLRGIAVLLLVYGIAATWGALQGNGNPLQPLSVPVSTQSSGTTNAAHESLFYKTDSVTDVRQIISSSPQPVMLDLYADWCISCKVMEEEIFEQSDVQQALAGVRWLQLDVTDSTDEQIAFLENIAVFGPPTVLFYENGDELSHLRVAGEVGKQQFLDHTRPLHQ